MILPEFTAPGYLGRTLNDVQRCLNWYPEKTAEGHVLHSTPGQALLDTVANSAGCRGAIYCGTGQLYSVHGNTVYSIGSNGADTALSSTLSASTGPVYMAENLTQVLVVQSATNGYIITKSSGSVGVIGDANFPASPVGAAFHDGYFIVCNGATNRFYLSALNDGTDWTPASFASAESNSDYAAGVVSNGDNVFVFGSKTIEPWYNTGNPSFPFERVNGGTVRFGVLSFDTVAKLGSRLFCVATGDGVRGSVWMYQGGWTRVSTPTIEARIGAWTFTAGTMFGFAYSDNGHDFYHITLADTATFVFDATTGLWHQRDSDNLNHQRARLVVNAFNDGTASGFDPFVFNYNDGKVSALRYSANLEDASTITRIKEFGPIGDGTKILFHKRIEIILEADHDSSTSYTLSGTLSWSDNGGLSFTTPITLSKAITSGTTGQLVRLYANRLGSSRKRIYRWTMTPAARIILKTCDLDLQAGRH